MQENSDYPQELNLPLKLEITPSNLGKENVRGKKTKVLLYPDRIEYYINYTYDVNLVNEELGTKTPKRFKHLEEGLMWKKNIQAIVKYEENTVDPEDEDTYPSIELQSSATPLAFELRREEVDGIYKQLYNWLINN